MKILDREVLNTLVIVGSIIWFSNTAGATTTISARAEGSVSTGGDTSRVFYESIQPSTDSLLGQSLSVVDTPINGAHLVDSNYGYVKVLSSVRSETTHDVANSGSVVDGQWVTTFNPGAASQITVNIATYGGIGVYATSTSDNSTSANALVTITMGVGRSSFTEQGFLQTTGSGGTYSDYYLFATDGQNKELTYNEFFARHSFVANVTPYQDNQIYFDASCGVGIAYQNGSSPISADASCDLSHSIYWDGITSAKDANGKNVAIPAINSPSGFDFRYSSPLDPYPLLPAPTSIPEPANAALLLGGLGLLGIARRRCR